MRYILIIAEDDTAGVLKVVCHNNCQKKEKIDKDFFFWLNKKGLVCHWLLTSIDYSIIIIKSNKNEKLTMNPKRGGSTAIPRAIF
jgi:hypothetical protein